MTPRLIVAIVACGLGLSACGGASSTADTAPVEHSTVTEIAGTSVKEVALTPQAGVRLGIETTQVRKATGRGREGLRTLPFSAVLYDVNGKTWVFTGPQSGPFRRAELVVVDVVGEDAFVSTGPGVGTLVVTVGAAELYGAELGVGK